ncbi:hypothetical protein K2173_026296 [Erythroxylum novogranatense]|uniref:soluble epoxide hydrolase n=1 Tax=Erythroxylum novogranatense TaxID=1862640 RepID=A0AAV8SBP7_9ROSI|nr:hypothetical protein K2173_026296 [Erythroxylum novogranatense]
MEKINHSTVTTNGIKMHVASTGSNSAPVILFLHGFPDLWYTWRHQLLHLSALGYRCIAPDLRGFGDTDAPASVSQYTVFHVVGDLVGLLDSLSIGQVFLVGHDWGAMIAWHFCLFRPDRVKALVNMSIALFPRNPVKRPVDKYRELFGDDFYICRFQKNQIVWQEPGEIEEDFAQMETSAIIRRFLTSRNPKPPCIAKEIGFRGLPVIRDMPSWLSDADIDYYASKYDQKGFTGGLNYYRCMNLSWELMAPWDGLQITVPVKFMVGDLDITYNTPGVKEYIHNGGFKKVVPYLQEVVVMAGVAHFLNQEKPDEVSTHIYDFIKKF